MKGILILLLVFGILRALMAPVRSHNPFTSKPSTQHKAPKPLFKSQFFV